LGGGKGASLRREKTFSSKERGSAVNVRDATEGKKFTFLPSGEEDAKGERTKREGKRNAHGGGDKWGNSQRTM